MNTTVHVKEVVKTFNRGKVIALNGVSFSLEEGNVLAIVGESGSGKTTLIRLITGLEVLDTGVITLNESMVSSDTIFVAPEKRKVGLVFQDYALFPHLTVYENIGYGISKSVQKNNRIKEVLALVGLPNIEDRYPHELSGGQQQRVALARALAPSPELLILDEPFSNLDVLLRNQLREDLLKIIKKTKTTAIFVTHDIKDALAISDDILVLQNGNICQQGKTKEVIKVPKSDYVKLLLDSVYL